MPLDVNALVAWIVVSVAFIVIVMGLHIKVSRANKIDENKDEAPSH